MGFFATLPVGLAVPIQIMRATLNFKIPWSRSQVPLLGLRREGLRSYLLMPASIKMIFLSILRNLMWFLMRLMLGVVFLVQSDFYVLTLLSSLRCVGLTSAHYWVSK